MGAWGSALPLLHGRWSLHDPLRANERSEFAPWLLRAGALAHLVAVGRRQFSTDNCRSRFGLCCCGLLTEARVCRALLRRSRCGHLRRFRTAYGVGEPGGPPITDRVRVEQRWVWSPRSLQLHVVEMRRFGRPPHSRSSSAAPAPLPMIVETPSHVDASSKSSSLQIFNDGYLEVEIIHAQCRRYHDQASKPLVAPSSQWGDPTCTDRTLVRSKASRSCICMGLSSQM